MVNYPSVRQTSVLPELGCNDDLNRYGDLPETMPLDESLSNDVKETEYRHVVLTKELPEEDPREFSLSTPVRCSQALHR
jgi:hypothetical protein